MKNNRSQKSAVINKICFLLSTCFVLFTSFPASGANKPQTLVKIDDVRLNSARPVTIVSEDFNNDGAPDLISAYATDDGKGVLVSRQGNVDAFAPRNPEVYESIQAGKMPASFASETKVLDVPEKPDFVATGDFNGDGNKDILTANRDGNLYLLAGDGEGNFHAPQTIALNATITALTTGNFGNATSLIIGVHDSNSAAVLIYEGKRGLKSKPQKISLTSDATAFALGNLDGDNFNDIAIATGEEVLIFHGANNQKSQTADLNSRIERITVNSTIRDLTIGNFVWNRNNVSEIALLTEEGAIQLLQRNDLDVNHLTIEEVDAKQRETRENISRRRNGEQINIKNQTAWQSKNQTSQMVSRQIDFVGASSFRGSSQKILQTSNLSSHLTDDLIVTDFDGRQLKTISFDDGISNEGAKSSFIANDKNIVATLAMPRKVNGERDLIAFNDDGTSSINVIQAVLNITVNRFDDITPRSIASTCNGTANDCTLREAVAKANANAGSTINLPAGNYNLTISGAITGGGTGEAYAGNNSIGDLDVTANNISFVGAGATTTTITQTTPTLGTPSNDRILESDPLLAGNITTNISGITFKGGRSPDFGGAIISGSFGDVLNVTNCVFNNNIAQNGGSSGGAVAMLGGGTLTVAGSTFTGNAANHSGAASNVEFGGAVYVDDVNSAVTSLNLTNSTFTNNSANANGGAISLAYNLADNASILRNTFVTNQTTGGSGGAIQASGNGANATIQYNRFIGNTAATATNGKTFQFGGSGSAAANINLNWWGQNTGPAANDIVGVTPTIWLQLRHTASPNTILTAQTTTLTASFLTDSANNAVALSNLTALINLPITFNNAVRGTISAAQTTIQSSGTATATFTANAAGAGSADAKVDNQTTTASFTINKATPSVLVTTSGTPTEAAQPVTFTATIGNGSVVPTGNVTFSDGATSLGSSTLNSSGVATLTTRVLTVGGHTITAQYNGDANFLTNSNTVSQTISAPSAVFVDDNFAGSTDGQDLGSGRIFNRNAFATTANGLANVAANGTVNIADGSYAGGLNLATNSLIALSGNVAISGNFTQSNGILNATTGNLNFTGNFTRSGGTFTPNGGTVIFNGSTAQTISGTSATTFNNLTVNNVSGVTLSSDLTVNGALNLQAGIVNNSANTISIGAAGTSTVTAGSYVNGNVDKTFTGASSFVYPVGTANGYSPMTAAVTSGSGNLTVKAVQGVRSGLLATSALQRYWSLNGAGITTNLTFKYLDGDIPSGINENEFRVLRITNTNQFTQVPTTINATNNTATVTGISAFSDWALQRFNAATAASVSVGGRVTNANGRGILNAKIQMRESNGFVRVAMTNSFGYYHFDNVPTGESFVFEVKSKRYNFSESAQVVNITESNSSVDFRAGN